MVPASRNTLKEKNAGKWRKGFDFEGKCEGENESLTWNEEGKRRKRNTKSYSGFIFSLSVRMKQQKYGENALLLIGGLRRKGQLDWTVQIW